jgi:hypothetical protein
LEIIQQPWRTGVIIVSRASGLVLILTGLAVAIYASLKTDTNAVKTDFVQYTKPHPAVPIASAVAPGESLPAPPIPVVVTVTRRRVETSVAPEPRSGIPRDLETIGRQLQKELKRVGCYEGELNGVWTRPTRQAMKTFIDRVNARLPTDEPDSILLALVQAYPEKACGGGHCPAGQGLSETGSCLPNALLARTSGAKSAPIAEIAPVGRPTPAITGWTTTAVAPTVHPPTEPTPTEGRMALAGPAAPAGATQMPKAAPPGAAQRRPSLFAEYGVSWARNLFKQHDRAGIN